MHVFNEIESLPAILIAAYSLEQGLEEFYQLMAKRVENNSAQMIFERLAGIEEKHKERIFAEYGNIESAPNNRKEFEKQIQADYMEGGMTTEEYLQMFMPNQDSPQDVIELAMSIESQALDLYQRAADRHKDSDISSFFQRMSGEEKEHLLRLGELMEEVL